MRSYRVFISYSHTEREKCDIVRDALKGISQTGVELVPWSDNNLAAGTGFTEQIQNLISHSHLFVPIITPISHQRGWVHQEIGFAVASKVPVVPLCIGELPPGMVSMAHALELNDLAAECLPRLKQQNFRELVAQSGKSWLPSGECAGEPGMRAQVIERLADEARRNLGPQIVRNSGGLSSFRIANARADHPIWRAHYGDKPRSHADFGYFRGERNALASHADVAGCKLIVNHGVDLDKEYGSGVWSSRIRSLVMYLESLPDDKVEIALVTKAAPHAWLAVGDWFLAESAAVRPVRGIQNTLFATHAPSIDRRIQEFDEDLKELISLQGSPPGQSRPWAIQVLKKRMDELPRHPDWP
jgi:hypothetical protein